jgi:hypothetical protein
MIMQIALIVRFSVMLNTRVRGSFMCPYVCVRRTLECSSANYDKKLSGGGDFSN